MGMTFQFLFGGCQISYALFSFWTGATWIPAAAVCWLRKSNPRLTFKNLQVGSKYTSQNLRETFLLVLDEKQMHVFSQIKICQIHFWNLKLSKSSAQKPAFSLNAWCILKFIIPCFILLASVNDSLIIISQFNL